MIDFVESFHFCVTELHRLIYYKKQAFERLKDYHWSCLNIYIYILFSLEYLRFTKYKQRKNKCYIIFAERRSSVYFRQIVYLFTQVGLFHWGALLFTTVNKTITRLLWTFLQNRHLTEMVLERTLLFFGTMITTSALAFSMCSQFWVDFVFQGKNYNAGLWSVCLKDDEECLSYNKWLQGEDIPSWLKQTRILIAAACTMAGMGLMTSLLSIIHLKIKCVFTSLMQFICSALLIGVCVIYSEKKYYHNEHRLVSIQLLWGFYLTVATAVWAFVLAIYGIFADYCSCAKDRTLELTYGIYADV